MFPRETPAAVLHPALEPSAQERLGPVRAGPEEATKVLGGLELLCSRDSLRELGLLILQKRGLWGDPIAALQCSKRAYRKEGEWLWTRTHSDRTRENSSN